MTSPKPKRSASKELIEYIEYHSLQQMHYIELMGSMLLKCYSASYIGDFSFDITRGSIKLRGYLRL